MAEIVRESQEGFEAVILRAFEAGREVGRNEAMADMKNRMFSMFEAPKPRTAHVAVARDASVVSEETIRAAPGSIRPKIERLLKDNPGGLTKKEVVERTGFKENTVRGTLWTLGKERFADHDGGRWFAIPKEEGPPERLPGDPFR